MNEDTDIHEGTLLGIGNPLLDITIVADAQFLHKYNLKPNDAILAGPEQLGLIADMMANYKPHYRAGGATQNSIRVAQWLLQKPNSTCFLGGVGSDEQARLLQDKAREAGVNVRYSQCSLAPTGTCAAVITGENRSLVAHLGAADYFTHEWLEQPNQWLMVQQAQMFYIGGFVFPVCHQSIFDVAKHALKTNKTLVMNLSAPFLCKYYADKRHNIMQYIDVLFGNETEAQTFCDLRGIKYDSLEEMAVATSSLSKLNEGRERVVVFTQGCDPIVVAKGSEVKTYEVPKVDHSLIKDTTGCGDAFVGGFLAQLAQNKELDECVRCGIYASQVVLQHWGCNYPQQPAADFVQMQNK